MIRALVFDTDAPLRGTASPSVVTGDARLAGLTLLQRAALAARKTGARSIALVGANSSDATLKGGMSRVPEAEVLTAETLPDEWADDDWVLVLSATILPRFGLPDRVVRQAAESERSLAAVAPEGQVSAVAVLRAGKIRAGAGSGGLAEAVRSVLAGGQCHRMPVAEGEYRHLDTSEAVRQADREIYLGLTSVTDGYIDRVFNRHISRWFTRRFINLPITPNGVTWFHFSLGLLAAWLFWQGGYGQSVLGAVLFQLSVALDCTDGEIARLKYQFSKFGSWLDVWTDNVVTVAIFLAVCHAAATRLGTGLASTLGVLSLLGVACSIAVVFVMAKLLDRRRPGQASTLAVTNRLSTDSQAVAVARPSAVDAVINEATSRDFSVIVVACALVGHLEWFAWLSGIGSHVFWITFGAIQFSLLRTPNAQSR